MYVIPRAILSKVRNHPLINSTYPTDIGWFPRAAYHFRDRQHGAPEDHLMLCTAGKGSLVIDGEQVLLSAGQMVIIPKDTPHTYWASDEDPWSLYWVHFLGEDAHYFVNRMPQRGVPAPVERKTQTEAVQLFQLCLAAMRDDYSLTTMIYAAQATQHILSLLLFRNRSLKPEIRNKSTIDGIETAIEYMQDHFSEPLRLEDIARSAGISVSHFSDRFKAHTGQSPMAYFIHLRMRHACRLLDLTGSPIKSVAFQTGYRDPYYFSRLFKKHLGTSPARYRAIKKN